MGEVVDLDTLPDLHRSDDDASGDSLIHLEMLVLEQTWDGRRRGRPGTLWAQSHFCQPRGIVIGVLYDGTTTLLYLGYDES